MNIRRQIKEAMNAGDVEKVEALFTRKPRLLKHRPIAGGSWLHYACRFSTLSVVKYLIEIGFDVNDKAEMEGDGPICWAARANKIDIAQYLLTVGIILDTSKSVRNPLFSCTTGRSIQIAKLLLDHGIDASVSYKWYKSDGMDACAFALLNGQNGIADVIASHLSDGDAQKKAELLNAAKSVAAANGPLVPVRILKT